MFDDEVEIKIRKEFEEGSHLKDLAIKYKVPLPTLKNRKKRSELRGDPWIKGVNAKLRYVEHVESMERTRQATLKVINDRARKEMQEIDELVDEAYKSRDPDKINEAEISSSKRRKRIYGTLKLKKEIEGIYSDKEEAEIKKIKVEIEIKRQELEEKRLDYQVKKLTADHYLKER